MESETGAVGSWSDLFANPTADQHQQASAVPSSTNDEGSGTAEPAKAPMFGSGPETSLKELSWINEPGSETRVKLASTEKPIPDLMLAEYRNEQSASPNLRLKSPLGIGPVSSGDEPSGFDTRRRPFIREGHGGRRRNSRRAETRGQGRRERGIGQGVRLVRRDDLRESALAGGQ